MQSVATVAKWYVQEVQSQRQRQNKIHNDLWWWDNNNPLFFNLGTRLSEFCLFKLAALNSFKLFYKLTGIKQYCDPHIIAAVSILTYLGIFSIKLTLNTDK